MHFYMTQRSNAQNNNVHTFPLQTKEEILTLTASLHNFPGHAVNELNIPFPVERLAYTCRLYLHGKGLANK